MIDHGRFESGLIKVLSSSFNDMLYDLLSQIISYCGYVVSRDCKPPIIIRIIRSMDMAFRL